jgi:hypothetical protein
MRTKKPATNQSSSPFPVREFNGLSWVFGHEIVASRTGALSDEDSLAKAIREQWPTSHPNQRALVLRRYRELCGPLPEADALKGIRAGHSSPDQAMRTGLIPKRKYVGFKADTP